MASEGEQMDGFPSNSSSLKIMRENQAIRDYWGEREGLFPGDEKIAGDTSEPLFCFMPPIQEA